MIQVAINNNANYEAYAPVVDVRSHIKECQQNKFSF